MSPPAAPQTPDAGDSAAEPVLREVLLDRVRRFALLRAAERALAHSATPSRAEDRSAEVERLQEQLRGLSAQFDGSGDSAVLDSEALREADLALDAYQQSLSDELTSLPLARLRASLSSDTKQQRIEVWALLRLCLLSEPELRRFLRAVDFLVTLLCVGLEDERWTMERDPVELGDEVRERCQTTAPIDPAFQAQIIERFHGAAERLASGRAGPALAKEISAYKVDVSDHLFVPAVLRSLVTYNVAARNFFDDRKRQSRARDAAIEDELGLFAPKLEGVRRPRRSREVALPRSVGQSRRQERTAGGGRRRSAALTGAIAVLAVLMLVQLLPSSDPRRVSELDRRQARDLSPVLVSAYRDHADEGSLLVGRLSALWHELDPNTRERHARIIRDRAAVRGVAELLLVDEDHVLQAHWAGGRWQSAQGWEG